MTSIWELESLINLKNKLKNILISRKVDVSDDDNLSTLVNKVNDVRDNVELEGLLSNNLAEFKSESLTKLSDFAFAGTTQLLNINIFNCTYIGSMAFRNSGIKELKILKDGIINSSTTFYYCNNIEKIILPLFKNDTSKFITETFRNCPKLQLVDINTLTRLENLLFYNDDALKTLIFRRIIEINSLSSLSILPTNFQSNGFLYVPESLLDSYKTATNWSAIANRIIKLEGTIYEDIYWSNKDMMFIQVDSIEYEIPKDTTVLQYKNTYQIEHLYSDEIELADDKLLHDYINTTITTEVE